MHTTGSTDAQPDFVIDDEDRYSRLRLIGWWDQERISSAKILVVGAGALGNEVLKNLALLGVGTIHLIDFDEVQPSNLTRSVLYRQHHTGQPKAIIAAQMAMELNPDCNVVPHQADVLTDVGLGWVRDMDLVIGCLDNREARLWVNRLCFKANRPWIDGGIQEINGVAKVFMPPHGPCYECAMTDNDYKLISLRYSCPLLKQEDIQQGKVPTAPTIASIVGGIQVQEALKLLHDLPAAEGSALVFNGAANKFYATQYPLKEDCLSHETYTDIIDHLPLSADTSIKSLFQQLRHTEAIDDDGPLNLILDRDFVMSLDCRHCQHSVDVGKPRSQVNHTDAFCQQCDQIMHPNSLAEIASDAIPPGIAEKTLREIGVPVYDIIKIRSLNQQYHVLLSQDSIGGSADGI